MNALALLTFSAINLGTAGYTLAQQDAQPPAGTATKDPASTGSTEVGNQGSFATATQDDGESTDATELEASVGGILSTGNAELGSATSLIKFRLRRGQHQFRAEFAGNYGRATTESESTRIEFVRDGNGELVLDDDGDPTFDEIVTTETNAWEETVRNLQGLLRYDWFFSKRWSLFAQATARHDRFQELDLRLNVDPGFSFYALTQAKQRLWFEAGYDFQYDIRTDAVVDASEADPAVDDVDKTFTNHAVRLYAGYVNNLNEFVTFDTGLEYLQSVVDAPVFRINWISGLTANLTSKVSLATTFTLRYENQPVAPKQLDTITSVLLGIRFI